MVDCGGDDLWHDENIVVKRPAAIMSTSVAFFILVFFFVAKLSFIN